MDPNDMSEEFYERCRAKDIKKIMAMINALPKVPQDHCVDLEPFRNLDAVYQALRVRIDLFILLGQSLNAMTDLFTRRRNN